MTRDPIDPESVAWRAGGCAPGPCSFVSQAGGARLFELFLGLAEQTPGTASLRRVASDPETRHQPRQRRSPRRRSFLQQPLQPTADMKIGRASCRERVYTAEAAGT